MTRIVLGVIGGFVAWMIAFVGSEKIIAAILPDTFGAHHRAFEAALKNGGSFTADTTLLITQIFLAALACVMAGFLAALIAAENVRAPLALGVLLLAMGILKAVMSWPYVPLWYHVIFTLLLLPLAVAGGKLS